MTTPGVPEIPVGLSNQPYYVRERKSFAIDQENYRHNQAIWSIGELVIITLMWAYEDFENGYVLRCPRCFSSQDLEGRAASVYEQPTQTRCPLCYGTTFNGGIRAQIVRPGIFSDTDDDERKSERGITHPQNSIFESTSDFRSRSGDYVFRQDGSRWQLSVPQRVTLRTGFEHPTQQTTSLGYARMTATLEDESSVAYLIPPTTKQAIHDTLVPPSRYPAPPADVINGPLIPPLGVTD